MSEEKKLSKQAMAVCEANVSMQVEAPKNDENILLKDCR